MATSTQSTESPISAGVRRRLELSQPAVRAAAGFAEVLSEAVARRWGDKLERSHRERQLCAEIAGPRTSIVELFESIGRDVAERRAEMVAADAALERARRQRREKCRRRDRAAKRLVLELGRFRKAARDLLGPETVRQIPNLSGPTLRDPFALSLQAEFDIAWATDPDHPPAQPTGGVRVAWAKLAAGLIPLRDEALAAIHEVYRAKARIDAALEVRDRALAAFDKTYRRGSRLLECLLTYLGLPTLAAAVRPHLKVAGRVGRPSAVAPLDEHPDLVARIRAAGLLPAQAVAGTADAARTAERLRLKLVGGAWWRGLVGWVSGPDAVADPPQPSAAGRPPAASGRESTVSGRESAAARWPTRAVGWWRRLRDAA